MDLRNPFFRWSIGLLSGGIVATVGHVFLDGNAQTIAYVIALIDGITTPYLLKHVS